MSSTAVNNIENRSTSSSPITTTSTSTNTNNNNVNMAKSTHQTHQKSAVIRAAEETVKVKINLKYPFLVYKIFI